MGDEVPLHGLEDDVSVQVRCDADGVGGSAESDVAHPHIVNGDVRVGEDPGGEPLLVVGVDDMPRCRYSYTGTGPTSDAGEIISALTIQCAGRGPDKPSLRES